MSKANKSLLLGMLLGDGYLKTKRHTLLDGSSTVYHEYVLCHSTKQQEYLEHKLNLFHSIMGGKKPKIHIEKIGDYQACRFSRCHKSFRLLHKYLYSKNDKKFFTKRVLKYLTPHAIAIWFMDDGCLTHNKNTQGNISSYEMRLYTYFSGEEADNAVEYFFEKWGIMVKKRYYKKNEKWNLIFNTSESKKLEALIGQYVIESMSYKLPSKLFPRALDTSKGDDIV